MTYVSRKTWFIFPRWLDHDDPACNYIVHRRRSQGRLKKYTSCDDMRAWTDHCDLQSQYFIELMSSGEICQESRFDAVGRFIPIKVLLSYLQGYGACNCRGRSKRDDVRLIRSLKILCEAIRLLETVHKIVNSESPPVDRYVKLKGKSSSEVSQYSSFPEIGSCPEENSYQASDPCRKVEPDPCEGLDSFRRRDTCLGEDPCVGFRSSRTLYNYPESDSRLEMDPCRKKDPCQEADPLGVMDSSCRETFPRIKSLRPCCTHKKGQLHHCSSQYRQTMDEISQLHIRLEEIKKDKKRLTKQIKYSQMMLGECDASKSRVTEIYNSNEEEKITKLYKTLEKINMEKTDVLNKMIRAVETLKSIRRCCCDATKRGKGPCRRTTSGCMGLDPVNNQNDGRTPNRGCSVASLRCPCCGSQSKITRSRSGLDNNRPSCSGCVKRPTSGTRREGSVVSFCSTSDSLGWVQYLTDLLDPPQEPRPPCKKQTTVRDYSKIRVRSLPTFNQEALNRSPVASCENLPPPCNTSYKHYKKTGCQNRKPFDYSNRRSKSENSINEVLRVYERKLEKFFCLEEQVLDLKRRSALSEHFKSQWLKSSGDESKLQTECKRNFKNLEYNLEAIRMERDEFRRDKENLCVENDRLKEEIQRLQCESKSSSRYLQNHRSMELERQQLRGEVKELKVNMSQYERESKCQREANEQLENTCKLQQQEIKRLNCRIKKLLKVNNTLCDPIQPLEPLKRSMQRSRSLGRSFCDKVDDPCLDILSKSGCASSKIPYRTKCYEPCKVPERSPWEWAKNPSGLKSYYRTKTSGLKSCYRASDCFPAGYR